MASHLTTAERDAIIAGAVAHLGRAFSAAAANHNSHVIARRRVLNRAWALANPVAPEPEDDADDWFWPSRQFLEENEADLIATERKEGW